MSKRVLSDETEKALADLVNVRRNKALTHDAQISQMARDMFDLFHAQQLVDNSKPIATRADGPVRSFTASRGWTYSFKRRHNITNTAHPIIRPHRKKRQVILHQFILFLPHVKPTALSARASYQHG